MMNPNLNQGLSLIHKSSNLADEYFRALDSSYILSISDLKGKITYVNDN